MAILSGCHYSFIYSAVYYLHLELTLYFILYENTIDIYAICIACFRYNPQSAGDWREPTKKTIFGSDLIFSTRKNLCSN